MKRMKSLCMALLLVLAAGMLAGCGKKYEALSTGMAGEIDVMLWSGSSTYLEDVGHQNYAEGELKGQNDAAVYAMAKKFNETYPNIKINVYAKTGDPDSNDTPWAQELENFKAQYGKYPDIYASTDLSGDVARGMVADLSVFADDPVYQSFNKSIMNMMNYYGFQAGLPQYMLPWGVYVNKELAEQNNIDVPPVDWNIDEYTAFVSSADNKTFWGAMDVPMSFINGGNKDITYSLANYKGEGDHVNLNSDAVAKLLEYVPKWSKSAVWTQNDVGGVPAEVMDANWWWGFKFFIENVILTNDGDPWMMGDAANPEEGFANAAKSKDWDIYPRPSTDYVENTVGIVLDPMAIHNYAMDDGDPAWSDAEKDALKVAYTFASFWVGSNESFQVRADQTFDDQGTLKTALNDSLPLVTGKDFDKQMEIWASVPTHQRFGDAKKMPGFQKVIEIWEKGQFWDISDKAYPLKIMQDGTRVEADKEWRFIYQAENVSVLRTDPNWLDEVKSKLPDWNTNINQRFVEADNQLREGLKSYYGFTDENFKVKK